MAVAVLTLLGEDAEAKERAFLFLTGPAVVVENPTHLP
jgi:hypothetical protein